MNRLPPAAGQRGFSLIVSLVLLALITLVALAGMRDVAIQTRISATTHDRNVAFQAAEAGLRDAEQSAIGSTVSDYPAVGCSGLFCATPAPADTARWNDPDFAGWTATGSQTSTGAVAPEAIVENMGDGANWFGCMQEIPRQPNCVTPRYRVTARSGAADRANVMVQSEVAAP